MQGLAAWSALQTTTFDMDYHLKFRLDSMKPAATGVGQPGKTRLPNSSAPMLFRSKCKPIPLGQNPGGPEAAEGNPEPVLQGTGSPKRPKAPADVQKQVKQLQFWLKVFSRFCQDSK